MSEPILRISGLRKTFRSDWLWRESVALRDVSLEVRRGEAFGFLGHNGAGKTTTMKCLLGLLSRNCGEVWFEGQLLTSPEQRNRIGYLPELPYFYDHLTVEESLKYFAALYGIRRERSARVRETLARVGLLDRRKQSVVTLSKGLQQRLGFAQAIINSPSLLLLDEPFSGLDPIGRKEMRQILTELHREGTTLFLSSHILSDVQNLCETVSVMATGEVLRTFAIKESGALFGERFELTLRAPSPALKEELSRSGTPLEPQSSMTDEQLTILFCTNAAAQAALEKALKEGAQVSEFRAVPKSLEEIFLSLTGPTLTNSANAEEKL